MSNNVDQMIVDEETRLSPAANSSQGQQQQTTNSEGIWTPYAKYTKLAEMPVDPIGGKLKMNPRHLLDDGSNYTAWAADMDDIIKANRIAPYLDAQFCQVILNYDVHGQHTDREHDLYILHSGRMLHLKQLIKGALGDTNRKLVEEAEFNSPAKMWDRIRKQCIVNTESNNAILIRMWQQLEVKAFSNISQYRLAEINLVDRLTAANLPHLVTESSRVTKIITTLPNTEAAGHVKAKLVNDDIKESTVAIQLISKWENLEGEKFFGGSKVVVGQRTPAAPTTTTSFATAVRECTYCRDNHFRSDNHTYEQCTRRAKTCLLCPHIHNHETKNCFKIKRLAKEQEESETVAKTSEKRFKPYNKNRKGKKSANGSQETDETKKQGQFSTSGAVKPKAKLKQQKGARISVGMVKVGENNEKDNSTILSEGMATLNLYDALVDTGSTSTLFNNAELFNYLLPCSITVETVGGSSTEVVKGYGPATLMLDNVTLHIAKAYYTPESKQNIIAFDDVLEVFKCSLHKEHMLLNAPTGDIKIKWTDKRSHVLMKPSTFMYHLSITDVWHQRLGHLSNKTMLRMIDNDAVKEVKTLREYLENSNHTYPCITCVVSKAQSKPYHETSDQNYGVLERIDFDIGGPYTPATIQNCRYTLLGVDFASRKGAVSLIKSKNEAYKHILIHLFKWIEIHPDKRIRVIRLDNAGEFKSRAFKQFCDANGIEIQYSIPYEHQTNGIAESFVKKITTVARTVLAGSSLPRESWGLAVLHANAIVSSWPHATLGYKSPHEIFHGYKPSIEFVRVFGCAVYITTPKEQRTKFGPRAKKFIYVGYQSESIVKVLEITTGRLINARYQHCTFDESSFPSLTCDLVTDLYDEVVDEADESLINEYVNDLMQQRFKDNSKYLNAMGNLFQTGHATGTKRKQVDDDDYIVENIEMLDEDEDRVVERQIARTINTPAKQNTSSISSSEASSSAKPSMIPIEHFVPDMGDLDADGNPRAPKGFKIQTDLPRTRGKRVPVYHLALTDETLEEVTHTISVLFSTTTETIPKNWEEAKTLPSWPEWSKAIQSEYDSLKARKVFSEVMELPNGQNLIGNRLVLTIKDEAVKRYKARLVAQGFSQKYGIDYEATYSPVMDSQTYRYLIAIATYQAWEIHAMDVQTAYLYGDLSENIYMKVPQGIPIPNHIKRPCVKLLKSLYGLKQSGRQWFLKYSEVLKQNGFINTTECPSVFAKLTKYGPVIAPIYVDDTNIMGNPTAIADVKKTLKSTFQMKDFGKVAQCIGIEIEHLPNGTFIHQSKLIAKLIKIMNLENTKVRQTPLQVRSTHIDTDLYGPIRDGETVYEHIRSYRQYVGMISYLALTTRPDLAFAVNLLARFSNKPTHRHYNGLKHIAGYLKGTSDVGLYYRKGDKCVLEIYADAGYRSDCITSKSQTGWVYLLNGTAIFWSSNKQSLTATSSFEAELIAMYEGSRDVEWVIRFTKMLTETLNIRLFDPPIATFGDNKPSINQIASGYIRSNSNKHINPRWYRTHEMMKTGLINVKHIPGDENPSDVLTKTLNPTSHAKCMKLLGLCSKADIV